LFLRLCSVCASSAGLWKILSLENINPMGGGPFVRVSGNSLSGGFASEMVSFLPGKAFVQSLLHD